MSDYDDYLDRALDPDGPLARGAEAGRLSLAEHVALAKYRRIAVEDAIATSEADPKLLVRVFCPAKKCGDVIATVVRLEPIGAFLYRAELRSRPGDFLTGDLPEYLELDRLMRLGGETILDPEAFTEATSGYTAKNVIRNLPLAPHDDPPEQVVTYWRDFLALDAPTVVDVNRDEPGYTPRLDVALWARCDHHPRVHRLDRQALIAEAETATSKGKVGKYPWPPETLTERRWND